MTTALCRRLTLVFLCSLGISSPSFAQTDQDQIKKTVEGFLNGYVQSLERLLSGKHNEERGWIYRNTATTRAFKDAYRRMEKAGIAEREADPGESGADFITLWAGDVPSVPYVLVSATVTGNRATAAAQTKDKQPPTVKLMLVRQDGAWVINSINDVNRGREARK